MSPNPFLRPLVPAFSRIVRSISTPVALCNAKHARSFSFTRTACSDAVLRTEFFVDGPFKGATMEPFPEKTMEVLFRDVNVEDVDITPAGLVFLPHDKYQGILNEAFGHGKWQMVPRDELFVRKTTELPGYVMMSQEYALLAHDRFLSQARGQQLAPEKDLESESGKEAAARKVAENALLRCAKDLGVASNLWEKTFGEEFKRDHADLVDSKDVITGIRKLVYKKKGGRLPDHLVEQ